MRMFILGSGEYEIGNLAFASKIINFLYTKHNFSLITTTTLNNFTTYSTQQHIFCYNNATTLQQQNTKANVYMTLFY